jgi:hypothetical protein
MLQTFKNGQGSIVLRVKLLDSSVATGAGLTGLTSASSGLIISTIADNEATATAYTVAASNVETITTLGTYAAPTASKCRFKEVDATNHKGVYELQFADARFAVSGAKSLLVSIAGATNLAQCDFVIQLQTVDPYISGGTLAVNVSQFGGTNGTFSGGRPEVNTTHAAGTAWGSGAITAASIAADAITAAKVADDVSTEIRTKVMALTTASGVVGSGSTTANVVASSVAVGATTSLSADAWKGRVIIFNSDTATAALRGQAAAIVSHTSGSTPTFTLATGAWTTAPLSSDTFTVV